MRKRWGTSSLVMWLSCHTFFRYDSAKSCKSRRPYKAKSIFGLPPIKLSFLEIAPVQVTPQKSSWQKKIFAGSLMRNLSIDTASYSCIGSCTLNLIAVWIHAPADFMKFPHLLTLFSVTTPITVAGNDRLNVSSGLSFRHSLGLVHPTWPVAALTAKTWAPFVFSYITVHILVTVHEERFPTLLVRDIC